MKKIVILCLTIALLPALMLGCSKARQPVEEQPLQEQPNVVMQQPLQDMVTQAGDQAQKAVDETKSMAVEATEAVQAKAAEVASDWKGQLQDLNTQADTLKTDVASEIPSAPEMPDQTAVGSVGQEVKDLAATQTEALLKEKLDSTVENLQSVVAEKVSDVLKTGSETESTAVEAGTAAADQVVTVTETSLAVADQTTTAATETGATALEEAAKTTEDAAATAEGAVSGQV